MDTSLPSYLLLYIYSLSLTAISSPWYNMFLLLCIYYEHAVVMEKYCDIYMILKQ